MPYESRGIEALQLPTKRPPSQLTEVRGMCMNRRRTLSGQLADRIFLVAFLHTKPRTRPDWALDGLVLRIRPPMTANASVSSAIPGFMRRNECCGRRIFQSRLGMLNNAVARPRAVRQTK